MTHYKIDQVARLLPAQTVPAGWLARCAPPSGRLGCLMAGDVFVIVVPTLTVIDRIYE